MEEHGSFLDKFAVWRKIVDKCPAMHKAPIPFCFYFGAPCCYEKCPRRRYEPELRKEGVPLFEKFDILTEEMKKTKDSIDDVVGQLEDLTSVVKKLAEKETSGGNPRRANSGWIPARRDKSDN